MILGQRTLPYQPRHARMFDPSLDAAETGPRFWGDACPGLHCAGRVRLHRHRNDAIPVHVLTADQIMAGYAR